MKIKIIPLVLILSLLTGCSGGNHTDKPVAQIALAGSFSSDNYLFEVFLDKKVKITSAKSVWLHDDDKTFDVNEVKVQKEILLTQEQFDKLFNSVDGFIEEDLKKIEFKATDPAPNFSITAACGDKINDLSGSLFVNVDENGNYIQTEMAHKLMLILKEISPIPIDFVRAPY